MGVNPDALPRLFESMVMRPARIYNESYAAKACLMSFRIACGLLIFSAFGVQFAPAAGPGGQTSVKSGRSFACTITRKVLTNTNFTGSPADTGSAVYEEVTLTTQIFGRTFTKSHRSLTVTLTGAAGLDGLSVSYQLIGSPQVVFPSTVIANGGATLHLSTINGDLVPIVQKGATITATASSPPLLGLWDWSFQADPVITTTTCGR